MWHVRRLVGACVRALLVLINLQDVYHAIVKTPVNALPLRELCKKDILAVPYCPTAPRRRATRYSMWLGSVTLNREFKFLITPGFIVVFRKTDCHNNNKRIYYKLLLYLDYNPSHNYLTKHTLFRDSKECKTIASNVV